jgi:hypothetical protein
VTEHQEAHARLSPSSSKGWLKCAGRITLEAAFPNTSNTASDEGTAMHTVAKMCLTEHWPASKAIGTKVPVHALGELTRVVVFTEEMAELTQGYVDTVRALGVGNLMLIEHRVDFSGYVDVPGQFGTADCIILTPLDGGGFEMFVIDLKTGWVLVDPENNSQGMLYALGALAELEMAYDIRSVRIGIYQPKHGGMREWTLSTDALMCFADIAKTAALRVEDAAITHAGLIDAGEGIDAWASAYLHPDPNEEDCRFCRAMATCPAMARKVLESLDRSAFSEVVEMVPPALGRYDDSLSAKMSATGMIEDWIKAVRAEVERRLLAGQAVEGWGLELGREGARKWTDTEAAETMLRKTFRLKIEDAFDLSLKSPTSVEKMTKATAEAPAAIGAKQWTKIQTLIGRSPAKPSVKPAAQIKKPYTPPELSADGFAASTEGEQENLA